MLKPILQHSVVLVRADLFLNKIALSFIGECHNTFEIVLNYTPLRCRLITPNNNRKEFTALLFQHNANEP